MKRTNEVSDRENGGYKEGRGVFLLFVGAMFLLIYGCWWTIKQYIPYDIKTEYDFDSGIDIEKQIYISTQPLFFPDILRHDGVFMVKNNTGYQICIATDSEGFLFLEQGEYTIQGKPLVFFVVKPETEENVNYNGQVTISENAATSFVYSIQGNRNMIQKVAYKVEKR